MAISYDNSTTGLSSNGSSLTFSQTVGSLTNGILIVALATGDTSDGVTSVTNNGSAMTLLAKFHGRSYHWQYVYYYLNPPSGSNSISISGTSLNGIAALSASYSGVSQSGVPDAYADINISSVTSATGTLTTNSNNAWLIWPAISSDNGGTPSGGTGTTLRQNLATGSNVNVGTFALYDSNGSVGTAGSHSLVAQSTNSGNFYGILFSLAPAIAPSSPTNAAILLAQLI